jgi:hypothetical protein
VRIADLPDSSLVARCLCPIRVRSAQTLVPDRESAGRSRRLWSSSQWTLSWRETDSNPRSPVKENQLTRAPRLTATGVSPRRSDTCACRPVAVAIRADTVVGGTRYIANLQCPRLSHYAASNKTRIMLE